MHTLGILALGIIIGIEGPKLLGRITASLINRKIVKSLTPQDVDPDKLCQGPHSWMNTRAVTDNGPTTIQVCRVCGYVPGMEKMVSSEAIDAIEEANKVRDLEERLYKDFINKEDDNIKKYFDQEINSGVSLEKLTKLHAAGMTFSARYNIYKSEKAEEIEKELNKSDA